MTANTLEQHILSIVCSVFDAYSAVLFLPSENGEEHYLAASFSLGEGVEQGAMLSSGSLVDWIIRNRQQMLVPNFDQHKHKLGYYREGEEAGIKAYKGILNNFVKVNSDKTLSLTRCCEVSGLGPGLSAKVLKAAPKVKENKRRDGSFEYYISEPIRDNDGKGVGPFIWASLEMEHLGYDVESLNK